MTNGELLEYLCTQSDRDLEKIEQILIADPALPVLGTAPIRRRSTRVIGRRAGPARVKCGLGPKTGDGPCRHCCWDRDDAISNRKAFRIWLAMMVPLVLALTVIGYIQVPAIMRGERRWSRPGRL